MVCFQHRIVEPFNVGISLIYIFTVQTVFKLELSLPRAWPRQVSRGQDLAEPWPSSSNFARTQYSTIKYIKLILGEILYFFD